MLQYDGVDLIGDNVDSEAQDFIRRFIPTESFKPWLTPFYPGWNLAALTSVNGYQWGHQFKLNRLYWPSGASRFAFGHFLCNSDSVAKISADAFPQGQPYQQLLFSIGNPESNSTDGSGTINPGETFNALMYMLPPYPLSGIRGLTGMKQSLYLITLIDERYFWFWNSWGNQVITSTTTWDSLIKKIVTVLNIDITVDTINAAYLAPSVQAFSLPYEPLPIIIDAICYNLGFRFVANGLPIADPNANNSYAMQLYSTALTAFNTDMQNHNMRLIVSGGQKFASPL